MRSFSSSSVGHVCPSLFLCISLLLTGVYAEFLFGLTIFHSHHMFSQVSLSPALALGDTAFQALPAQDRLIIPRDWPCVPCPLTPSARKAQPRGSCRSDCRVRVNQVCHIDVKLTLYLATSTPLKVPPPYVGSLTKSLRSLWEGLGSFPCLFPMLLQCPSPHPCSSVPDLRMAWGLNLDEGS